MNSLNEELIKNIQTELRSRKMEQYYIAVTPKGKTRLYDLEDDCKVVRDDNGKILTDDNILTWLNSVNSSSIIMAS